MRRFSDYNPIVVFVYYMLVAGITMFVMNPILLALSLLGAVMLTCSKKEKKGKSLLWGLCFFVVLTLINPLFVHKGVTVLFMFNNNPITLEAFAYGAAAACMILAVFNWFSSFSKDLTSDKLLYLFGGLSPKLALLLSMTFRYIPLFAEQRKKVDTAQRAMGLYKEDNAISLIQGKTRVFSVMVGWALENGIITADSMEMRGYGTGKRSSFSIFRFRLNDLYMLLICMFLAGLCLYGIISGKVNYEYYPRLQLDIKGVWTLISYISFALLTALPCINNLMEGIKWRYLQSKI